MEANILFTVIREKLLTAGQPVTLVMFNTLIEVFTMWSDLSTSELVTVVNFD